MLESLPSLQVQTLAMFSLDSTCCIGSTADDCDIVSQRLQHSLILACINGLKLVAFLSIADITHALSLIGGYCSDWLWEDFGDLVLETGTRTRADISE